MGKMAVTRNPGTTAPGATLATSSLTPWTSSRTCTPRCADGFARSPSLCGQRNAWNAAGPTPDLPLLVTVIDECQTYLDLAQHKGDRATEDLTRRCIALTGELIRKGRSVLCLTVLATQKTTGDSIPTSLRDNSGLAVSFALKTTECSVAALGDAIREYPGYSPTLLRETPNGIGTAVTTLTTGTDPFTRLRVPEITEQWAARARHRDRAPPARSENAGAFDGWRWRSS